MSKQGTSTSNLQNGLFLHTLIALQKLLGQSLHRFSLSSRYSHDLHFCPGGRHCPVLETIKSFGQAAIHFDEVPSFVKKRPFRHWTHVVALSQTAHPWIVQPAQIDLEESPKVPGGQNYPQTDLTPSLASCKNKFGVQAVHFWIESQVLHCIGHFLQMFC